MTAVADALVGRESDFRVKPIPGRLLVHPHLFAHELRTPLTILAGWVSLIRDGDIDRQTAPCQWERAMSACEDAVVRLNLIIAEACDEAGALALLQKGGLDPDRLDEMVESARSALTQSQQVLVQVRSENSEQ